MVGDGSKLCYNTLKEEIPTLVYPPCHLEMQRASGVAMAAEQLIKEGKTVSSNDMTPSYLRLSQAERERLKKEQEMKGDS